MFHEVFCFPVATKEVWALIFWGLCQFWKHIFTIYYLFHRKSFQGTAKVWQINFCDLFLRLIGKTTVSRNSKPEWLWTILLACTDHLLKYILFCCCCFLSLREKLRIWKWFLGNVPVVSSLWHPFKFPPVAASYALCCHIGDRGRCI